MSILDVQPEKLGYLHDITQGHITTFISNRMTIGEEIADADLVIGAVLIPGSQAPMLVSRSMLVLLSHWKVFRSERFLGLHIPRGLRVEKGGQV